MANYTPRVCAICGREYKPASPSSKYCSRECQMEAERQRDRARYAKRLEREGWRKEPKQTSEPLRGLPDELTGKHPGDYARRQTADTIEKYARITLSGGTRTMTAQDKELQDLRRAHDDLKAEFDRIAAEETKLLHLIGICRKTIQSQAETIADLTEELEGKFTQRARA